MKFKKVMAGALTGTMMLGMATVAFAEPVYYTDDKTEVAADFSNVKLATLVAETTASSDIASIKYTLKCADDVSFNEYSAIHFVVTVDGTATDYNVMGIGADSPYSADEWTTGFELADQELKLDAPIASGSTYKVEAYTQSWAGAADYVYDIVVSTGADDSGDSGDVAPVGYLAAAAALAGAALVVTRKKLA